MSIKGDIISRIERFRTKYDLYQVLTRAARKSIILLDCPVEFQPDDSDRLEQCLLENLIEKVTPNFKIICLATFAQFGIPTYFLTRLQVLDNADEFLGPSGAIPENDQGSLQDSFNKPIDY